MKFIKRLLLVIRYKGELDQLMVKMRQERLHADRMRKKDFLNLCARHQPRMPGAEHAEHNCDHCNALRDLESAQITLKSVERAQNAK